jgi:hypothetical protein
VRKRLSPALSSRREKRLLIRGCQEDLCRKCLLVDESDSNDSDSNDSDSNDNEGNILYDCRLAVMNNLIRSLELLAFEAQTPAQTEDLVRPIAVQTFLPESVYEIIGAAVYTGYDAQTEYLIAPFPSGNFYQYYFSTSEIASVTEMSDGVFVIENDIEAIYYIYDYSNPQELPSVGGPVTGQQVFTFTFPTESTSIQTSSTTVQLDLAFVQELGQFIAQSDLTQLCGAILGLCDATGYPTGYYADITDFEAGVAACVTQLETLTGFGLDQDTVPCRQLHIILAQEKPDIHCAHVAKDSTKCINT